MTLKYILDVKKVDFAFIKSNGEYRKAYGTRNLKFVPEEFHPVSNNSKSENENNIKFFDLEKNSWRSFSSDKVIYYEYEGMDSVEKLIELIRLQHYKAFNDNNSSDYVLGYITSYLQYAAQTDTNFNEMISQRINTLQVENSIDTE